jgi:hypothetical protein
MKTNAVVGVVVLLSAGFLGGEAAGYSISQTDFGFTMRWGSSLVPYHLNAAGSDNIGNGSDIQAIESAFSDWEAVSCSDLTFEYQGGTDANSVQSLGGESNDQNDITFVENSTWTLGKQVLGVTIPLGMGNGAFVEVDIAFNGYHHKWTTTGKKWRVDVKSVAIHEIGHFVGIQHVLGGYSQYNPPTMAPQNDPYGKMASLEADDMLAACYLYPDGGTFKCDNNEQCPYVVENEPNTGKEFYGSKLECTASICQPPSQPSMPVLKVLGDPCTSGDECQDDLFCQPIGAAAFCAKDCKPSSPDCPISYICLPYPGGETGACVPNSAAGGASNGTPCIANEDCKSGNCFPDLSGGWACRATCDSDAADICEDGASCLGLPGYGTGGCLPDDLLVDYKIANGHPCNEAEDCLSGNCVKSAPASPSICRPSCIGPDDCEPGMACMALDPTGMACVPEEHVTKTPGALGDACGNADECGSGACVDNVCVDPCTITDSCGPSDPSDPPVKPSDPVVDPTITSGNGSSGCQFPSNRSTTAPNWLLLVVVGLWTTRLWIQRT